MVQITCYYLVNIINPEEDVILIFIRYEKFFKIILNNRPQTTAELSNLILEIFILKKYILTII